MNGVHDLGGTHGFGPVEREIDEPVFHADWEPRVLAMVRIVAGQEYFTGDAHRRAIESIAPAEYLRASYYERWLAALETLMTEQGVLTGDELVQRIEFLRQHPDATTPRTAVTAPPPSPVPPSPPPPAPRFAVGDAVMTRNIHPIHHTRLPRYARGKRGIIQFLYGPRTFPDTNAHGLGEQPQPLYSVRFDARELWGDDAEPHQTVALDLWDSYLDPAPA